MESDRLAAQPSAEPDDELYRLIVSFNAARRQGDAALAMRYIDRARRIAPARPEINYFHGQQLLAESASLALPFLELAADNQASPRFEAAVISALVSNQELERAASRLESALSRFAVTPGGPLAKLARRLTQDLAPRWPGWVGVAPDLRLCGEIVACDSNPWLSLHERHLPLSRDYLVNAGPDGIAPFMVRLKQNFTPRMMDATARGAVLLGGAIALPPDFAMDGRASLVGDKISGWVSMAWTAVETIQILIAGRGGFRLRIATEPDPIDAGHHRFSLDRQLCAEGGNRLVFQAMLPDGNYARLPDSPLLIEPPRPPRPRRLIRKDGERRKAAQPDRVVDVIIPVYRGVAETCACIRSVVETVSDAEIVVIDDGSPDPDMGPALESFAHSGAITLIRNPRNIGFPRTVNRGFGLHPDRDVVVLNADTEVYGDWLARLRAAAYSQPDIGSVTPLTNSGSIASYPKSENDCASDEAAALDRLACVVNDGAPIDIPTGVGFCLYLRRACLDQTGYFDTIVFGHGYGEENDLCLRANRLGWRHVLAPNVFVRHLGSRSFGTRRKPLFERNNRLINLRYPGYDADIRDFLAADPAHGARRRLDEERLMHNARAHVLLVTLALEGGVRRAVNERAASWRENGIAAITLKPDTTRPGGCVLGVDDEAFDDLAYQVPGELPTLMRLLDRLSIESIELHHFLGLAPELIEQLFRLGPPVDIWAHDYVWYCPRITLLGGDDRYCGEPTVQACEICIQENGATLEEPMTVAALRERSARWLAAARTVLTPSIDLARRLQGKFPGLSPRVAPLEAPVPARPVTYQPGATLKVALIGAIGVQKGFNILLEAAADAAERALPLEFIVIGYTKDDNAVRSSGNVFITGQYEETEIERLIARETPHVALFLSVFPETWCYALTHAFRAGLPVAAFDFGAVAERLRAGHGAGILFPPSATAKEINDGLLKAFPVLPPPAPALLPAVAAASGRAVALAPLENDNAADHLQARTQGLRDGMVQHLGQLTASVEVLPLVKGLYLFSVGATDSRRIGDDHELVLPALQIGLGPGTPPEHVEFMLGPRTEGTWLCEARDHIIVKVKASSTILLLTSLRAQGMSSLEIDVKRLDGPQAARPVQTAQKPPEPPANMAPRAAPALPVQRKPPAEPAGNNTARPVPLRVTVHVQRRGDMIFNENQWAGVNGQRLSIESFSIVPLDELTSELIEYKAVTASGLETPWVSGGTLCGTRGMGMPLVGFAVRMKPQDSAKDYVCEYSAMMVSGATLGPARNGVPCRSVDIGDPIEAIWVSINKANIDQRLLDRAPVQSSGGKPPRQTAFADGEPAPRMAEPAVAAAQPEAAVIAEPPRARPPIGPRFSVFRDPVE